MGLIFYSLPEHIKTSLKTNIPGKILACYNGFIRHLNGGPDVIIDIEVLPGQQYSITVDKYWISNYDYAYQGMAVAVTFFENKTTPKIEKRYLSIEEEKELERLRKEIKLLVDEF